MNKRRVFYSSRQAPVVFQPLVLRCCRSGFSQKRFAVLVFLSPLFIHEFCLQGNDGNIRKFTVNSIAKSVSIFPRAHTCFNRIDLPIYESKKELKKFLTMAIQMEATGFDID